MNQDDIQRFNDIAKLIGGKEEKGRYKYMALCPAHGDAKLSLWMELHDDGKITLFCHAGCDVYQICSAIGIKTSMLWPIPQIVAVYDFIDLNGNLLYQEVKYDKSAPKPFQVRRPNPNPKSKDEKDKWIYNRKDIPLILYNLRDVAELKEGSLVFMCEGCKDARNVKYKSGNRLIATAALFNDWVNTDTRPLDGKNIVILQDNDDGGKIKALKAAHDRFGKSKAVRVLLLPGLKDGGDVTDWFEAGNTWEKLIELATSPDLPEWFPYASVREQIKNKEFTGLSFDPRDHIEMWTTWEETFHPLIEGPLIYWDDTWWKGSRDTLLYKEFYLNEILGSQLDFFQYTYDASKKGDQKFMPTHELMAKVTKVGMLKRDKNVVRNPHTPIFMPNNPFFQQKKIDDYKSEDIIIMKTHNFYVPERVVFPRNLEQCIAMHAVPFDYEENAKCPEIDKAFDIQWKDDTESKMMLLQFLAYYLGNSHNYKAILNLVGESDSGKSKILDLIRLFIGPNNCDALSLGKIGNRFELWRARNSRLLICDDVRLTSQDLRDGAVVENIKSISAGAPIRVERKNGEVISRVMACQMLLAANQVPKITEFSNALSNRFFFLMFPHVFVRGVDMNPNILELWTPELPGLFNKVLDAIPILHQQQGFIEPKASEKAREEFEGGGNPARKFLRLECDVNDIGDKIKYHERIQDVLDAYAKFNDEEGLNPLSKPNFYRALESVAGIFRTQIKVKIKDADSGEIKFKGVKCWEGFRLKGNSGIITLENSVKESEF